MSLHAFFEMPEKVDFAIGVGGYFYPFSEFRPTEGRVRVVYGLEDKKRPWEVVKLAYEKRLEVGKEIVLLENTGHEIDDKVREEIVNFMRPKL